jgi:Xaa-Pro aminopeptidase
LLEKPAMTLDFADHRARILARLAPDEAVLVFGAPHPLRNGDAEHRYRPDSDVYWLTGWDDPECAVFLRPGAAPLTLFVQPKNPEREVWDGFRPGPEGALAHFGADQAFPIGALETELPRLLQGVNRLHYAFAVDADHDALVRSAMLKAARAARRNGLSSPETLHGLSVALHEERLRKGPDELAVLREAARVSAAAHVAAMRVARPGATEFQVEAALTHVFLEQGSTGAGYVPIVATGANACTLHYKRNRDTLRDGDLLLVDAGCEISYYTADITRTFPVGRRFTEPQRQLYAVVLAAQEAAIARATVGSTLVAVHDAAVDVLVDGLLSLGFLGGSRAQALATEAYKRWYMHGTSHWLGLDVHDVGVYGRDGRVRELPAGAVLTVEPGLYIPANDALAPEAFRGIGIRIEDDILVTDAGPENLTAAAPKSIDELEALRAEALGR